MINEPLSLYIHYPFCVRKCRYCDFLSGPSGEEERKQYIDALLLELERPLDPEEPLVDTVFFGGGTPSLMDPEDLLHIMDKIRGRFHVMDDAEITMECNPGTVTAEKLHAFHSCGINRLSIGVQSFHDSELSMLGRIHTAKEAAECVRMAQEESFSSVSLDLMSALPGQSMESWMDNLETAVSLHPQHISAYSLILEEGTELLSMAKKGELPPVPDDELDRAMYHRTKSYLEESGYHRYEISNYAMDGFESRHNSGYWTGHDYLGLGLGASSMTGHVRYKNTDSMEEYLEHPGIPQEVTPLSVKDQMGEFMWLGLRMTRGVSEEEFQKRFGKPIDDIFGEIIRGHVKSGLLVRENGRIFLSEYGTDISNYVMCDFV